MTKPAARRAEQPRAQRQQLRRRLEQHKAHRLQQSRGLKCRSPRRPGAQRLQHCDRLQLPLRPAPRTRAPRLLWQVHLPWETAPQLRRLQRLLLVRPSPMPPLRRRRLRPAVRRREHSPRRRTVPWSSQSHQLRPRAGRTARHRRRRQLQTARRRCMRRRPRHPLGPQGWQQCRWPRRPRCRPRRRLCMLQAAAKRSLVQWRLRRIAPRRRGMTGWAPPSHRLPGRPHPHRNSPLPRPRPLPLSLQSRPRGSRRARRTWSA